MTVTRADYHPRHLRTWLQLGQRLKTLNVQFHHDSTADGNHEVNNHEVTHRGATSEKRDGKEEDTEEGGRDGIQKKKKKIDNVDRKNSSDTDTENESPHDIVYHHSLSNI